MIRWFAALLLAAQLLGAESLDLSSPELVAEGAELFSKSCSVGYCHGAEGRAARGPALRGRSWDVHELYRITAEGVPGTAMPGWKGVVSDSALWAVTAYVLSLSPKPPSGVEAIVELDPLIDAPEAAVELSEQAERGRTAFFDLTRQRRCAVCHEVDGAGTAIGPNLALAARSKSEGQLTRDILRPHSRVAFGFEQVQLVLLSGERVAGVLAEESDTKIRIFDAASIPHPLRTVSKSNILRQRSRKRSSMPQDLNKVYSKAEIASIVAYLHEVGNPN